MTMRSFRNTQQYKIRSLHSSYSTAPPLVFDRLAHNIHKTRSAKLPNSRKYDYLKDMSAMRICDRLSDINRTFNNGMLYFSNPTLLYLKSKCAL